MSKRPSFLNFATISSMWMPIFSGSLSRPAQTTRRPSGVSIRPCSLVSLVLLVLLVFFIRNLLHGNLRFSLSQLKTVFLKLQKSFISHLTQFVRHCTSVNRQVVRKLLPVKRDLDVRTVLFLCLFGEISEQFFSRCAPCRSTYSPFLNVRSLAPRQESMAAISSSPTPENSFVLFSTGTNSFITGLFCCKYNRNICFIVL